MCVKIIFSGSKRLEHSILTSYISLIENSKHYIYIENQFFISSISGVCFTLIHSHTYYLFSTITHTHIFIYVCACSIPFMIYHIELISPYTALRLKIQSCKYLLNAFWYVFYYQPKRLPTKQAY